MEIELTKLAYTKAELAAATGLSVDSISKAIERSELAAKYYGTKPIIPAAEALRWIESLPDERPGRAA